MMIKRFVVGLMMVAASVVGVASLSPVDTFAVTCQAGTIRGSGVSAPTWADCNIPADEKTDLMSTLTTIINVIVGLVGVIAVAVIVLGGITFATSQGDAGKAAKARNTILYGVVGLVIALLAFAIVNFVLQSVF